jgi:hypothetical protein
VNGTNFWTGPGHAAHAGEIKHLRFVKLESGKPGVLVTQNAWLSSERKKICEDERTLRFDTDGNARWIDFDITLKALDKPVTFGDDKEGSFALRVAETLSVDAKKGGRIISSRGLIDGEAWAKTASWVDYHGPIGDETVGIAVFNHP